MSTLIDYSRFSQESYDYEDYSTDEIDEPKEWLYIGEEQGCSIIAYRESGDSWFVVNGHWYGFIDNNGEFICEETNKSLGKPTIFEDEKLGNMGGDYNRMIWYADKKFSHVFNNIRNILQNETDNWLGGVLT